MTSFSSISERYFCRSSQKAVVWKQSVTCSKVSPQTQKEHCKSEEENTPRQGSFNTGRGNVCNTQNGPTSCRLSNSVQRLHENLVVTTCLWMSRDVGHRGAVAGGPATERRSAETKNTSGVLTCDMLPGWAGRREDCETNQRHNVSSDNSQAAWVIFHLDTYFHQNSRKSSNSWWFSLLIIH